MCVCVCACVCVYLFNKVRSGPFTQMHAEDFRCAMDSVRALRGDSDRNVAQAALALYANMRERGVQPVNEVYHSLLATLRAVGDWDACFRVFDATKSDELSDPTTFAMMMQICYLSDDLARAKDVLARMDFVRVRPPVEAVVPLLSLVAFKRNDPIAALELFAKYAVGADLQFQTDPRVTELLAAVQTAASSASPPPPPPSVSSSSSLTSPLLRDTHTVSAESP